MGIKFYDYSYCRFSERQDHAHVFNEHGLCVNATCGFKVDPSALIPIEESKSE